jgi:hypothetical protein
MQCYIAIRSKLIGLSELVGDFLPKGFHLQLVGASRQ